LIYPKTFFVSTGINYDKNILTYMDIDSWRGEEREKALPPKEDTVF